MLVNFEKKIQIFYGRENTFCLHHTKYFLIAGSPVLSVRLIAHNVNRGLSGIIRIFKLKANR